MSSRDKILAVVKGNQPEEKELPFPIQPSMEPSAEPSAESSVEPSAGAHASTAGEKDAVWRKFISVLEAIGGAAFVVSGFSRIAVLIKEQFPAGVRIVSGCPELSGMAEIRDHYEDPHTLENVELAVLRAHFGVAENGACWITEDRLIERALPFIAQHLALVLDKGAVVDNMHQAYERIGDADYGFGTFIAGPSKTADIEQSLVLGAHGPRSLIVFLIDEELSDAGFY